MYFILFFYAKRLGPIDLNGHLKTLKHRWLLQKYLIRLCTVCQKESVSSKLFVLIIFPNSKF